MKRLLLVPLMLLALAPGPVLSAPAGAPVASPPGASQARERVPLKVLVQRRRIAHKRMAALREEIRGLEGAVGTARNEFERREWQRRLDDRRHELVRLERLDRRLARAIKRGGL